MYNKYTLWVLKHLPANLNWAKGYVALWLALPILFTIGAIL